MTSTSITTVGGLVVVTQVIPQDERAIPLQAADANANINANATNATNANINANTANATNATNATPAPAPAPTNKMDDVSAATKGWMTQSLGVVQIFVGVLSLLFSLTAVLSPVLLSHAPLCLAVSFVISGSLAVAASRKSSVKLVRACLSWNMISVVFGVGGVAYLSFLLALPPVSKSLCEDCTRGMWVLDASVNGSRGLLLVLLVLQVVVSITVCVFSVRALRRHRPSHAPLTVMVDGDRSALCSATSLTDSDVALLDSDGDMPRPNSP